MRERKDIICSFVFAKLYLRNFIFNSSNVLATTDNLSRLKGSLFLVKNFFIFKQIKFEALL